MRERARVAVKGLARLAAARRHACSMPTARRDYVPVERDRARHDRPARGRRARAGRWQRSLTGRSELDCSHRHRRERAAVAVEPGAEVRAGTLNLTGPLTIEATAAAQDSFLAEMMRLMEAAESGRGALSRASPTGPPRSTPRSSI